ncbi:MAG: FliG C-terminal domain-containing protein [Paracoccaceae bacterium]
MSEDGATPDLPAPTSGATVPARLAPRPAPAGRDGGAVPLDPAEKAAVVLVALGPEMAANLMRQFDERPMRRFAAAVSRLHEVPRETVVAVVDEFLERLGDDTTVRGGIDEARRILGQILDEEQLSRVLEELDSRGGRSIWQRLGDAADAPFATWIGTEHPQVATVVLSKLRPEQAARLLERFEPAFAHDVVLRMSRVPTADSGAMEVLKSSIERDFVTAIERTQGARKPTELIAGLMNHVSASAREAFLAQMEESDPKLAQEVQRVMFTFSDISTRVAARAVPQVVRAVDEPVLLTALKTALALDDPSAEFILGNVARRLSERLREDLEAMPELRQKEGEQAQAEVVAAVRRLAQTGQIKLIELDGGED